jgi:cellulose synthase/poly-beta-1,6-N-acetylglucosamine synthase-like glycosyltransferase
MTRPFSDPDVVGVAGTYRTLNSGSPVARFVGYEIAHRHERMKGFEKIDFVGTYSAAYRKEVFDRFGGFDTSFATASGEDPELSFRIAAEGGKMVFCPNAFVWHRHPSSLAAYLRQKFNRAFWRMVLYRKHPSKLGGESYTPFSVNLQPLIALLLIASLLALPLNALSVYVFYTSVLLVLLLNLNFYRFMFSKEFMIGLLSIPVSFLRNFAFAAGLTAGMFYAFSRKVHR